METVNERLWWRIFLALAGTLLGLFIIANVFPVFFTGLLMLIFGCLEWFDDQGVNPALLVLLIPVVGGIIAVIVDARRRRKRPRQ